MNDNKTKRKEEIGERANKILVQELTAEISSEWKTNENQPIKPVVLMVGGLQGSGKTTVLGILKKWIDLIVISPDEIRHKLFSRGVKFSDEFVHTVNATRNTLLKIALSRKHHIAIDQFLNPERIDAVEDIVRKDKDYRTISVLLFTDKSVLEKRVKDRKSLPETYRGTIEELRASIKKYGYPELRLYDRVFDTQKLTPEQIADEIKKLLLQA